MNAREYLPRVIVAQQRASRGRDINSFKRALSLSLSRFGVCEVSTSSLELDSQAPINHFWSFYGREIMSYDRLAEMRGA